MRRIHHTILFLILFFALLNAAMGQVTVVKGKVTDAKSHEPLPFVVVQFDESNTAVTTDAQGNFELKTYNQTITKVKVNLIGYKTAVKDIVPGKEQHVHFKLHEVVHEVQEVVIKGKKGRYRNKDNPAVEFIRRVIDKKDQNRPQSFDYIEYEKYEKTQFGVSNITDNIKNKKILKNYQFVFDNLDSTKLKGKPVLSFYLRENISDVRYRKSPKAKKEIIKGTKTVSYKGYIDEDGLAAYMKYLYQDIDIYENNVILFSNQFISPIAGVAPTFYQYYLADTLLVDSVLCVHVSFRPRNKTEFLFQGEMYVTLDSNYAVKKLDMSVNPDINLNWVKELYIRQEFEKQDPKGYALVKDEIACDFGAKQNVKTGLYGQRTSSFVKFKVNQVRPAKDYQGLNVEMLDEAKTVPDSFWAQNRHDTLSANEQGIYKTVDSIQNVKSFKRVAQLGMVLIQGYKTLGIFEIGPVSTFYSFNPIEGFRLRFGGRTNTKFSKKINFETYIAYGFKDEKFKGFLGTTYSFTKRSIWEFPVKSIRASYQYDIKIPGQDLQFVQEGNFFLSFKRGTNDKFLYVESYFVEYLNEFRNHFSFAVGLRRNQQQAVGNLHFNRIDYNNLIADDNFMTTTEALLTLRYAPNEIFYQGKVYRSPIIRKYPVFTLRFASGMKGVLDGQYEFQNLNLNIFKRFYLSQLGFTDVTFEAGKIFGKVPFPLLYIHRANQSYSYQLQSYNLMNFLEFVSDEYQSLNVDHNFNGFMFNKVPLFKRLKWREFVTMKVLYGKISDQNNPNMDGSLYKLPKQLDGSPLTYSLEQIPYVEGGVGIGNIFKFFRIDLIKRFSYIHNPKVSELGIRLRMKFDF